LQRRCRTRWPNEKPTFHRSGHLRGRAGTKEPRGGSGRVLSTTPVPSTESDP
jgi:hypothetical protein